MKRFLALMLCLTLAFSLIPAAYAGDIEIVDTEDEIAFADLDEEPDADHGPDAEILSSSGNCGYRVKWELRGDTLTIRGTGDMYNYEEEQAPWYADREIIYHVVIENGVTSVGKNAFFDCDRMTDASLPDGLTTIGKYAFFNCNRMTDASLQDGLTTIGSHAFYSCKALSELQLPESLTRIDGYAFYDCVNLREIVIPKSLTTIGDRAFCGCSALKRIAFAGGGMSGFNSKAFLNVTALAYYPEGTSPNSLGGSFHWMQYTELFDLSGRVEDHTAGRAKQGFAVTLTDGRTDFCLYSESGPVLVLLKNGDEYAGVPCMEYIGLHRFTEELGEDAQIVLAFKGDVDLNGTVESRDGNMASRASVNKYEISDPVVLLTADVDGNGKIESRDGNMISRASVNKYTIPW